MNNYADTREKEASPLSPVYPRKEVELASWRRTLQKAPGDVPSLLGSEANRSGMPELQHAPATQSEPGVKGSCETCEPGIKGSCETSNERRNSKAKVNQMMAYLIVIRDYRILPWELYRGLEAVALGSVHIQKHLGSGTYNNVLQVSLTAAGDNALSIATSLILRLPKTNANTKAHHEAAVAGYGAASFCRSLSLPAPDIRYPQKIKLLNLPYVTIGEKIDGVPLSHIWNSASTSVKATALQDVARFIASLRKRRFSKVGSIIVTPEGDFLVGPKCSPFIDRANAADVNAKISKGPYLSWMEYLQALIAAIRVLNFERLPLPRRRYFQSNLDLCCQYLKEFPIFPPEIEDDTSTGYCLFHPDFNQWNVMVDKETGHLTGIIDWDGAYTCPSHYLAGYPFDLEPSTKYESAGENESDDDELEGDDYLCDVYEEQLQCLGADRLLLDTRTKAKAYMDDADKVFSSCGLGNVLEEAEFKDANGYDVYFCGFLLQMQDEGYIPDSETIHDSFELIEPIQTANESSQDD